MGAESRPINLFYGLSQGARAVAAARIDTRDWILRGHGIDQVGSLDKPIAAIRVVDTPDVRGSFTSIAKLLRSPSLTGETEVGDLLAALPLRTPRATWTDRPRAVLVENISQSNGAVLTFSPSIYARSQGWAVVPGVRELDLESKRAELAKYIYKHYPTLVGVEPLPDGHVPLFVGDHAMQFVFRLTASDHLGGEHLRRDLLYARTTEIAGGQFAMPSVGTAKQPCHPTIVLWACLWTFSMLARYEPVRWAKLLNVDASEDATALETILDDALDLVPMALLEAVGDASDWSAP
jgi:hypothetical protein